MNRRIVIYVLALFCITFLTSSAVYAAVLISKVQISGATSNDEFVELYNFSSSTQQLTGFQLLKQTKGGAQSTVASSSFAGRVIQPFGYFLVAHTEYVPVGGVVGGVVADIVATSTILAPDNSLLLLDEMKRTIDRIDWGDTVPPVGAPAGNPGKSMALSRLPNDENGNWMDTDDASKDFVIVPGSPFNSLSSPRQPGAPTTSTDASTTQGVIIEWSALKINEFLPNPVGGPEWVELFNTGSSSIDLTGSTLCDNKSTSCAIASPTGTIGALSWATIFLDSSHLNNTGDSVILKGPGGEVLDSVVYSGNMVPAEGQTLARKIDGVDTDSMDDWAITTMPTPGATNVIATPPAPIFSSGGGGGSSYTSASEGAKTTATSKTKTTTTTISDNVKIVWNVAAPRSARVSEIVTLDAARSADPRGGILSYAWSFSDTSTIIYSPLAIRTFSTSGLYTITVSASSTAGTRGSKTINFLVGSDDALLASGVFINEVFPNPADETAEYIELVNNATTSVDVSGWQLILGNGSNFSIPENTKIPSRTLLTFYRTATHLSMSNASDTVELRTPFGSLVDSVHFEKSPEGESYARAGGIWQWALPTPGEANALVLGEKISSESTSTPKKQKAKITKTISSATARSMSPLDVRSAPKGTRVSLRGIVVAAPGTFSTRYGYIATDEGGIEVYATTRAFATDTLRLGDEVTAVGTVSALNDVPRLNVKSDADVRVVGRGGEVRVASFDPSGADDPPLGAVVSMTGEVTEISGNTVYLDNGDTELAVYLRQNTHVSKSLFPKGENMRVTGILETAKNGVQLLPRSVADVVDLGPSEDIAPKETLSASRPSVSYPAATAGGVGILFLGWTFASRKKIFSALSVHLQKLKNKE